MKIMNLMKMKHAVLVLGLLMASGAEAALDCDKVITTPDINECAAQAQRAVEAKLNQVYRRVLKGLDQPNTATKNYVEIKNRLVQAQRLWVKFREADCDAVYEYYAGGTIRTMMYIGCMQLHAEQRMKALETYEQ